MSSSRTRGSGVGLASTVTPSENAISSGSWRGERWGWLSVGTNTGWIAGNAIFWIGFSILIFLFSSLTILVSGIYYYTSSVVTAASSYYTTDSWFYASCYYSLIVVSYSTTGAGYYYSTTGAYSFYSTTCVYSFYSTTCVYSFYSTTYVYYCKTTIDY
jgi:hypothetical protein